MSQNKPGEAMELDMMNHTAEELKNKIGELLKRTDPDVMTGHNEFDLHSQMRTSKECIQ